MLVITCIASAIHLCDILFKLRVIYNLAWNSCLPTIEYYRSHTTEILFSQIHYLTIFLWVNFSDFAEEKFWWRLGISPQIRLRRKLFKGTNKLKHSFILSEFKNFIKTGTSLTSKGNLSVFLPEHRPFNYNQIHLNSPCNISDWAPTVKYQQLCSWAHLPVKLSGSNKMFDKLKSPKVQVPVHEAIGIMREKSWSFEDKRCQWYFQMWDRFLWHRGIVL